jgi:hypothetical protein
LRRTLSWIVLGIAALAVTRLARAADPPRFEWKDGDRVVLIGDTLIERDQKFGYLETLITAQNPEKSIVFRNLGWSGDTVFGHARAGFGKPADGFKQLKDGVLGLKPTVLIVGYGMAESFDGEAGLPAFVSGLNALLDAVSSTKARLVLLSPIAHEDLGRPLPDPARHNLVLEKYRDAIKKVASERSAWFVDLYEPVVSAQTYGIAPLTDNGIHPPAYGYWYLASVLDMDLRGVKREPVWSVAHDRQRGLRATRAKASGFVATKQGLKLEVTDGSLPMPPIPANTNAPEDVIWLGARRTVRLGGLEAGRYTLTIDGKAVETADSGIWAKGVRLETGPDFNQVEALRAAINAKNELYFHRWRPENETYLFGFRKHEQGNNAREIPLFDPLVEAREKEIARLRVPVRHVYELTREAEVAQ